MGHPFRHREEVRWDAGIRDGVARLDDVVRLNGQDVEPEFIYNGLDANASGWAPTRYGKRLELQAGTTPTYDAGSPYHGNRDGSVQFNLGGYFQATDPTCGDVGSNCFLLEILGMFRGAGATPEQFMAKRSAGAGYQVYGELGKFVAYLKDSGGTGKWVNSAGSFLDDVWHHAVCAVDRVNGLAGWFVDGVASGAATDISAMTGSLANSIGLTLGARNTGAHPSDGCLALARMYVPEGGLGSYDQSALVADSFARLQGDR